MVDLPVKYGENTPSSEFSSALLQKTHLSPQGEGFTNAYTTILKIELFLQSERSTARVKRLFLSFEHFLTMKEGIVY